MYLLNGCVILDPTPIFLGHSIEEIQFYGNYDAPFVRSKWSFICKGIRDRWRQEKKEFGSFIFKKNLKGYWVKL